MFFLKEILQRYQGIKLPDETVRKEVINIIKEQTGLDLTIEQVKVRGQSLVFDAEPVVKSIIYTSKDKIQAELSARLGKKAPRKISF